MKNISIDVDLEKIIIVGMGLTSFEDRNLAFLSILLSEDKVKINNDEIILPFETFYSLNKSERKVLGFPDECDYSLSIKTNGAFLLPKFSISYTFKQNGRKVFDTKIKDHLISCSKQNCFN